MSKNTKSKKTGCWHDCKNPIVVNDSTYICRSCNEVIDPIHWFFVKQFESMGAKFVDVTPSERTKRVKKSKKLPPNNITTK